MNISIKDILKKAEDHKLKGEVRKAFDVYETILKQKPKHIETLFAKAKHYIYMEEPQKALPIFEELLKLTPTKHVIYVNIADCYVMMKDNSQAIDNYLKSIEFEPDYINPYVPCVNIMERTGRLEEAKDLVTNGLKIFPNDSGILFIKAKMEVREKNYQHADITFKKAYESGFPESIKHIAIGEYSAVKEKLSRYEEAFIICEEAQQCASQTKKAKDIDPTFRNQTIDVSAKWFSKEDVKGWEGVKFNDANPPLFLVGFPRSGTTLMEQILHSHSNFTVTDEVQVFLAKFQYMGSILGREIAYPAGMNDISYQEILSFREEYFQGMRKILPDLNESSTIVDKNPMTILYMGVVNRFFPDSHSIVMLRDPRDAVLSCFFQTFMPNPETINFFTLKNTAEFYARTMNLWLRYRDNLPMKMLEIRYEDLINDFENKAREIIDFTGKKWEDNVLEYYKKKNRRNINTPSYNAVNQPVNNKSVGKWKNYEKFFEPVMPILDPFIKEFGYD